MSEAAPGDIHPQVRIVVRPYGSPLPLGFFAFGIGMFLYAALSAEWVEPTETHTIGVLLAAFVAPLEFTAAILAFLARDTVAGVTLGLFATSWLSGGLLAIMAVPGMLSPAEGYWLIAFSIVIVLAIFCLSMYGGLAFLLEDLQGRTVLPIFRVGTSRAAIEEGLGTQLESLENEAGVRRPL